MLCHRGRDFETIDFLFGDLFGMRTHNQMHFMPAAIDLIEQPLQVNRSARARGGNDKFHRENVYCQFEFNPEQGQ